MTAEGDQSRAEPGRVSPVSDAALRELLAQAEDRFDATLVRFRMLTEEVDGGERVELDAFFRELGFDIPDIGP